MKLDGLKLASLAAPRGRNSSTFGSTKLRGVFLLVKPNGRKEWHQRYTRPDGRRNTIKLGDWPAVDEDGAIELGTANKALLLQLHTGLRIGEVLALEWANIDFRTQGFYRLRLSLSVSGCAGVVNR